MSEISLKIMTIGEYIVQFFVHIYPSVVFPKWMEFYQP